MTRFPFRNIFRWHVLAWLASSGYSLLGDFGGRQGFELQKALWHTASFSVSRIVTFYFCYLLVYPHLLRVGRLPLLLLGLGAAALLFAGVRAGLDESLFPAVLGFHNYTPDTTIGQYIRENMYFAVPTLVLSAALWAGEEALRREREHRLLVGEKRVAEAAFLKTQLNPHFLYNTLNMLYGMAYGVNKALADALLQLSALMRYMLRETPDGRVELAQEIDYLEHFLALYRLRFPHCLCAELTITGTLAGHRVAPLLLIPFVENAFKHGVLDDPATPVRLHLVLQPGVVEFTVENHCHDTTPDATSGIGLTNLRRRLALLYHGRHTLQVGPVGPVFRAYLRLVEDAASPALARPAAEPAPRPSALADAL